jgi:hypothetical protein
MLAPAEAKAPQMLEQRALAALELILADVFDGPHQS